MNKALSLIVNLVLVIAVAVLYYLHFSSRKESSVEKASQEPKQDIAVFTQADMPTQLNPAAILYVNADSLFEKYEYVKALRKDAEARQANIESRYTQKSQKFQEDYMAYQQKVSTGNISPDDARTTEEDLMRRKNELEELEQQLNKLMEEAQQKNVAVQTEVTEFFKEYAKGKNLSYVLAYTSNAGSVLFANDSLDATDQLLEVLNARYNQKKKK